MMNIACNGKFEHIRVLNKEKNYYILLLTVQILFLMPLIIILSCVLKIKINK